MKTLRILFLFLSTSFAFAQNKLSDKILKKDQTIIEANVLEIDDTQIKYKKINNLNGPTYTVLRQDVVSIEYANGETEFFNKVIPQKTSSEKEPTIGENPTASKPTNQFKPKWYYMGDIGYAKFDDYSNSIGGFYVSAGIGYSFARFISFDVMTGYATYNPDNPQGVIGITELKNYYIFPRLTLKAHFSKTSKIAIYGVGGAGFVGSGGTFKDFTQRGTPTYDLKGYSGVGYLIGGGIALGAVHLGMDVMGNSSLTTRRIGVEIRF